MVVAEEADELVDIWYYSLNVAAKKGVNLSSLFDIVQATNMAMKDPVTDTFLKRENGKIIKPPFTAGLFWNNTFEHFEMFVL